MQEQHAHSRLIHLLENWEVVATPLKVPTIASTKAKLWAVINEDKLEELEKEQKKWMKFESEYLKIEYQWWILDVLKKEKWNDQK